MKELSLIAALVLLAFIIGLCIAPTSPPTPSETWTSNLEELQRQNFINISALHAEVFEDLTSQVFIVRGLLCESNMTQKEIYTKDSLFKENVRLWNEGRLLLDTMRTASVEAYPRTQRVLNRQIDSALSNCIIAVDLIARRCPELVPGPKLPQNNNRTNKSVPYKSASLM